LYALQLQQGRENGSGIQSLFTIDRQLGRAREVARVKLKKKAPTAWMGNGFGTANAEWELKGWPGYTLRGSLGDWSVRRDSDNKRIVTGHTRNEAAELFLEVMREKEQRSN
jgi:hypothetical protein